MSRSTVLLSLITVLLLGGCNGTPQGSTTSSSPSEGGTERSAESEVIDSNGASEGVASTDEPSEAIPNPSASSSGSANSSGVAAPPAISRPVQQPAPTDPPKPPASVVPGETTNGSGSAIGAPLDTTIVPGKQFGVVTASTTYDQLVQEFGANQLTNTEVHLGEGFMAPATRVDLGNEYAFSVVWTDETRTAPMEVQEFGPGWKTPEGVYNGMSFADLEAALGSFELTGFGWDYGGTVMLENTALEPYSGQMFIRLQPSVAAVEASQDKLLAVTGDQFFNSTNANFDDLSLSVDQIVVRIEP